MFHKDIQYLMLPFVCLSPVSISGRLLRGVSGSRTSTASKFYYNNPKKYVVQVCLSQKCCHATQHVATLVRNCHGWHRGFMSDGWQQHRDKELEHFASSSVGILSSTASADVQLCQCANIIPTKHDCHPWQGQHKVNLNSVEGLPYMKQGGGKNDLRLVLLGIETGRRWALFWSPRSILPGSPAALLPEIWQPDTKQHLITSPYSSSSLSFSFSSSSS